MARIRSAITIKQWVIFHDVREEFLRSFESENPPSVLEWTINPWKAKTYRSVEEATEEAAHIAKKQGYTLDICELYRKNKETVVTFLLVVEPTGF